MRVLALLDPTAGTDPAQLRAHALEENRVVWRLYKAGVVRDMHMRADRPGAVLTLECDSIETAQARMRELPFIERGLLQVQLIPLGPFVPLENLFATPAP